MAYGLGLCVCKGECTTALRESALKSLKKANIYAFSPILCVIIRGGRPLGGQVEVRVMCESEGSRYYTVLKGGHGWGAPAQKGVRGAMPVSTRALSLNITSPQLVGGAPATK